MTGIDDRRGALVPGAGRLRDLPAVGVAEVLLVPVVVVVEEAE